jgi:hypothetical protein
LFYELLGFDVSVANIERKVMKKAKKVTPACVSIVSSLSMEMKTMKVKAVSRKSKRECMHG